MKLKIWTSGIFAIWLLAGSPDSSGAARGGLLGREGSELGNSFVPFDSKIGDYSLEYSKKWRFTDLSQTASFTDSEPASAAGASFLSVHTDRTGGPATPGELRERIARLQPSLIWEPVSLAGLSGFRSEKAGVVYLELLRGPRDLISLRYRSTEGDRSASVIAHMLKSFRAE